MELEILNRVHEVFHDITWLNYAMKYISMLAAHGEISIACCAILLIFKRTRRCGLAMAVALVVDFVVVNLILKNAVGRERPWTHEELGWAEDFYAQYGIELSRDYCFPSGHTAVTFCAAAVLVIFYRAKAIPAVFVALLIGFSRIYLCEHYVSDVAAGIIIGSLCGVAGYYIYRAVERAVLRAYDKNRYRLKARAFRTRLPKRYRENIFY
ncbi:MAG TPA: phosphatase PAP2 family protein [Candidatus Coproplasma stercoripullorum]|uniref:Phosphatase PAP2 family protein n=1 Tax=Candidatus Coproplasma stercoripullorum TaxID=2840751 RepID=A0A9D1AGX4_9FIRM|nr:phosphatase PAP2 family protein [Candidatus Coproplasma stercoripullorum]